MEYRLSAFILFCLLHQSALSLYAQQPYTPPANEKEFERQYQERITKDRLFGIYIPKNLDDALVQLDKLSSEESKKVFLSIPEDSVCRVMHNRLGQWMIVNWSFYEGSRLSHYLRSAGVSYPDDMADFLILAFHRHLNGKTVAVKELALRFREMRRKALEQDRRDGIEHLVVMPMYKQNGSPDTCFEALIVRVPWPRWAVELESRYDNAKFLPVEFVDGMLQDRIRKSPAAEHLRGQ